jgi:hypothetical protein
MAPVKANLTKAFVLGSFRGGWLQGVLNLTLAATVVPNMAAWVLAPAMGACTGLSGAFSACLLSYRHFAGGGVELSGPPFPSGPVSAAAAPPGYLVFMVIPLAATVIGGITAARRAASSRPEGAAVGSVAGGVFAALFGLVALLSQLTVAVAGGVPGFFAAGTFRVGPQLAAAIPIALAWGLAGGALGGWFGWRDGDQDEQAGQVTADEEAAEAE